MTYKVLISNAAKEEFKETHAFLKNKFGAEAATAFKQSFSKLILLLRRFPFTYPVDSRIPGMRKCASMSPTVVFYEVEGTIVTIHRIRDGRSLA